MTKCIEAESSVPKLTGRAYDYFILDVFTTSRLSGNPLAVFWNASELSQDIMQRIAGEMNLSETVFLSDDRSGSMKARIFTPRRELDFAGHPTIGSAAVIDRMRRQPRVFRILENVGFVEISIEGDGESDRVYWLTTPSISFHDTVDRNLTADCLGLTPSALASSLPQFVSAGSRFLFVQLNRPKDVDGAALHPAVLERALGSAESVGTFVFALKSPNGLDVYARMFAPQTGIPEDPATGGATGPLAAFMIANGLLPNGRNSAFVSEQGTKMGRRSLLYVRTSFVDGAPVIKVGGSVAFNARGTFYVDA